MARPVDLSSAKPFLFERSFDESLWDDVGAAKKAKAAAKVAEDAATAGEGEAEEPEAPPPPTFSEEELAAAKQDAYMDGHADGFREGHAESMDTLEARLVELLDQIAPLVATLGAEQVKANERAQTNVARIVQAVTAKLLPVYARKYGADEVMAVAVNCIAELQDAGRLTIRLSEETIEDVGDRLKKAADRAGFEGQLRMLPDEGLGPSDVLVDWGAGGAERVYDSIRADIDKAIDRAVQASEAEAELGLSDTEETASPAMDETPEQKLDEDQTLTPGAESAAQDEEPH